MRAYVRDLEKRKAAEIAPIEWAVIESAVFPGEDILVVLDETRLDAARAAHPGLVTYLASEIDALWPFRDNLDFLRRIHAVKKRLGGWLRELRPPESRREMSTLNGFMDQPGGGRQNV